GALAVCFRPDQRPHPPALHLPPSSPYRTQDGNSPNTPCSASLHSTTGSVAVILRIDNALWDLFHFSRRNVSGRWESGENPFVTFLTQKQPPSCSGKARTHRFWRTSFASGLNLDRVSGGREGGRKEEEFRGRAESSVHVMPFTPSLLSWFCKSYLHDLVHHLIASHCQVHSASMEVDGSKLTRHRRDEDRKWDRLRSQGNPKIPSSVNSRIGGGRVCSHGSCGDEGQVGGSPQVACRRM
ncbi:unnamed protein product, partial [Pleuronectes platessa]